jgi:hypothetical protein
MASRTAKREAQILKKLTEICLELPETARRESGDHADFRVRGKVPAYIGPRGWFGLRLDGEAIDWSEVRNLVELSYGLVAPKRLVNAYQMAGAARN